MSEDLEESVNILSNKLTKILDNMAPIKTFQVRSKYAPWLSNETKSKMKERDQAQKMAAESKSPEYWKKYKHLRNIVFR